jgi:hypothetical protein
MATIVGSRPSRLDHEDRFFIRSAIGMTLVVFAGFSFQLAMGRSSFALPIFLHIHAFFFFGWTVLYLTQNVLAGPEWSVASAARLDRARLDTGNADHGHLRHRRSG